MRKLSVLLAIVMIIAVATVASAEVFETTLERVDIATDKNGNEYVRLIVPLNRAEGGISYTKSVPAMCFGEKLVEQARGLKAGDSVKFAGDLGKYQGRESITVHAFAQ